MLQFVMGVENGKTNANSTEGLGAEFPMAERCALKTCANSYAIGVLKNISHI